MSETITSAKPHLFSQSNKSGFRNPWLLGILGWLVIVVSVNTFFITNAITSNPGLVVENFYERGQNWEQTMNTRMAERSALGWSLNVETPQQPRLGRPEPYRVVAVDRVGQPISDAEVTIHTYRPSDANADFDVTLEEIHPGVYQADVTFDLIGVWDLQVAIDRGTDHYDTTRRISVRP